MKIVYIAHPIGGDVKGNIAKVLKIVRQINLTEKDVVPLAPYLADLLCMDDSNPEERQRGMLNDFAVIKSGMINELWIYGPKLSKGMREEIATAWNHNVIIVAKDPHTIIPIQYRMILQKGY